jgi:toxin-antitoxin system PIN domain toxin
MSSTLDVNLLVYAADQSVEQHGRARALLDWVARSGRITYLFWPVALGYVRLVTHPGILRHPAESLADLDGLIGRPHVVVTGEPEGFWTTFKTLASARLPRGNGVPDAHLVSLMMAHGVSTIWTNDRAFRVYDDITVRNPFDERYASGFD